MNNHGDMIPYKVNPIQYRLYSCNTGVGFEIIVHVPENNSYIQMAGLREGSSIAEPFCIFPIDQKTLTKYHKLWYQDIIEEEVRKQVYSGFKGVVFTIYVDTSNLLEYSNAFDTEGVDYTLHNIVYNMEIFQIEPINLMFDHFIKTLNS